MEDAPSPPVALAGPVLATALIVPAYLPLLLQGVGFYTIPFTTISLDNSWLFMYLFGLVTPARGRSGYHVCTWVPVGTLAGKNADVFCRERRVGYA